MLVTLSGISIEGSEKQHANASFPIRMTPSGILIEVSDLQNSNAFSPILVMPSGITIAVSVLHLENALFPMLVTPVGMTTELDFPRYRFTVPCSMSKSEMGGIMTEDLFRIAVLEGNACFPIFLTLAGISIEESA